jgi:hypothetical protein
MNNRIQQVIFYFISIFVFFEPLKIQFFFCLFYSVPEFQKWQFEEPTYEEWIPEELIPDSGANYTDVVNNTLIGSSGPLHMYADIEPPFNFTNEFEILTLSLTLNLTGKQHFDYITVYLNSKSDNFVEYEIPTETPDKYVIEMKGLKSSNTMNSTGEKLTRHQLIFKPNDVYVHQINKNKIENRFANIYENIYKEAYQNAEFPSCSRSPESTIISRIGIRIGKGKGKFRISNVSLVIEQSGMFMIDLYNSVELAIGSTGPDRSIFGGFESVRKLLLKF